MAPRKTKAKKTTVVKKEVPPVVEELPVIEDESPIEEESEDLPLATPAAPKKRKVVTVETHLQRYDDLVSLLEAEIEKRKTNGDKGVRVFRTIRKNLCELKKEVPRIANGRRRSYNRADSDKVSGFDLPCNISAELAKFLDVSTDDTLSRKDITNALCVYTHLKPNEKRPQMLKWEKLNPGGKRNLQNPENKMSIKPDAALSKLLSYKQYQKDVKNGNITKEKKDPVTGQKTTVVVDDDALAYWVIQKLVKKHILGTIKSA